MANEFRVKNGLITLGNIAIGGSITSSLAVKAKYFNTNPNYGYNFDGVGSIRVDQVHGTALDLQDFNSLKIGDSNDYGTSSNTFLQGEENVAVGHIIHILGRQNSGFGEIIHIEGWRNRAEVDYGHTLGYHAIGHIVGSKTFANGSMDANFPYSTTQVSTIVLYAYNLMYTKYFLINLFYSTGEIDFNRVGLAIDDLQISFFLNVMITYHSSRSTYAYLQTFTYNTTGGIQIGAPYGDVSATAGILPEDLGYVTLVLDDVGIIRFSYTPSGSEDINSVIVKVEMIEHIVYGS